MESDMPFNVDAEIPLELEETSTAFHNEYREIVEQPAPVDANVAFWAVIDGALLVFILAGNILTILAVRFSRRLRSVISNMFILSLAISDMVVGFTLPYHLAFYIGSNLGTSRGWCLLRFFLIILACCVSIWNLIAIAVDRYIAIVYPLHYSRYMTARVAIILLSFGWLVGTTFALIPMFWNNWDSATKCEFDEILPKWYVAGVITPGFCSVWICMLIVYWRIWREASKHAKQLRSSFTGGLHDSPSDWKSIQVVLLILGCFSFCWLPYFIVAVAQLFKFMEERSPDLYKAVFSMAMANSAMNPIIYAWKNASFRRAFARLLRCRSPDSVDASQHSTRSNMHRKNSSLHAQDNTTVTSTPPPHSAINGNFNEFSININGSGLRRTTKTTDENNTGNVVPSVNGRRRSSLALPPGSMLPTTVEEKQTTFAIPTSTASTIVLANGTTKSLKNVSIAATQILTKINEKENSSILMTENGIENLVPVIEQIECDGNVNTQIRILNGFVERFDFQEEIKLSTNPKNTLNKKFRNAKKDVTVAKHSIIEYHPNGNLMVNHLNQMGRQIL